MITPWMIYLIGIADSARSVFMLVSLLLFVATIPTFVLERIFDDDNTKNPKKAIPSKIPKLFATGLLLALISTLTPSSKTTAAIYILPALANNEDIRAIGGNGVEVLRKLTEKWLIELSKDNDNGKGSAI